MRKQCKRVKRRNVAPTMVAMLLNPEFSIQERMAVQALRGGWATTDTFNVLADCRDMLLLAAGEREDQATIGVCQLAGIALMNMKDRYNAKKRMGATGDELAALDLLADTSESFWKRQSGGLFIDAETALTRCRKLNAEEIAMKEAA
ncbi:MAG: hypothetical protein PHV02_18095 [Rhodocyclaceae bacterium]|nr:hypothetical protein [Rhodocyclaceae bacterium]